MEAGSLGPPPNTPTPHRNAMRAVLAAADRPGGAGAARKAAVRCPKSEVRGRVLQPAVAVDI